MKGLITIVNIYTHILTIIFLIMFGTKVKAKEEKSISPSEQLQQLAPESCVIAKGTIIEGTFTSTSDIRMDGVIVGDIKTDKKLVMGDSGKIEGKAHCSGASISGKIEGEIKVQGPLHLSKSSFVSGKIIAKKLLVDEGASYSGETLIGDQHFK